MRNKKAQFFAIYLVLLTLVMCGFMIFMYFKQAENVNAMVVSPIPLLKMQDDSALIEIQEKNMFCLSLQGNAVKDDGNWNFETVSAEKIKTGFLDRLSENKETQDLLLKYIIFGGKNEQEIRSLMKTNEDEIAFFNRIYLEFSLANDNLAVKRIKLTKEFTLNPYSKNKNVKSFLVDAKYEIDEKIYNLNLNDLIKEC